MIKVKNESTNSIEVAINKWGNDGDTNYFAIHTSNSESWDRADPRGFILSLKMNAKVKPYIVLFDSNIVVNNESVIIDGVPHHLP